MQRSTTYCPILYRPHDRLFPLQLPIPSLLSRPCLPNIFPAFNSLANPTTQPQPNKQPAFAHSPTNQRSHLPPQKLFRGSAHTPAPNVYINLPVPRFSSLYPLCHCNCSTSHSALRQHTHGNLDVNTSSTYIKSNTESQDGCHCFHCCHCGALRFCCGSRYVHVCFCCCLRPGRSRWHTLGDTLWLMSTVAHCLTHAHAHLFTDWLLQTPRTAHRASRSVPLLAALARPLSTAA